jgi:DNA-binding transcriptional ArsR family regulator
MLNNARALSPQQSIPEFAGRVHAVARSTIAVAAIEIIVHLIDGPRDVGSLARATCLDIATVSKKLTNLRRAGLVTCRHDGSRHVYALRESITLISLGEHCLVLIPVDGGTGGVFAIGVSHTMLDRLQNGAGSPDRPRAA